MRRHNLALIIDRLHFAGPMSRSDLVTRTGLNRSTIGALVNELSELSLVEVGPATTASGPGRPSPIVRPRPEGAVVLAVELAVDSIAVATVGLGGHVFNHVRVERPRKHLLPVDAVAVIADLARPLLGSLPANHKFAGVGVAVVGVVRRSDGYLHIAPNLGWRDVPMGALLSDALSTGHPVSVANEADLGAIAEHRRGTYPNARNLIYVSGEVGIGAGIIADGVPLHGAAGYAAEAGHTLINPEGRPCRCGGTGCWETEAGEAALLRHAGTCGDTTGLAAIAELSRAAAAGEDSALCAFTQLGHWLGLGIGNLINLFNPDVVVLGGLYHRFYEYLELSVVKGAKSQALLPAWDVATITKAGLGTDAPLVGAGELALSALIADPARAESLREYHRARPLRESGAPVPRSQGA
ncbi:MAG: ROK family protein [Actinobacteria bacterium]|nr:ROK family protein [Actinomycetota bacterium]